MGLPNFCIRFRKDMILSDGVIFVASRTRFGSAQAGRAGKGAPQGSRLERLPFAKNGSRPAPQASKKGRRVPERLKTPKDSVKEFVPWGFPNI